MIQENYDNQKAGYQSALKMDSNDYRQKLLKRLNERSFISKNKKRTYNKDDQMARWVGSSFDLNEPMLDKINVKNSKKIMRRAAVHDADKVPTVPNLILSQYDYQIDGKFKQDIDNGIKEKDENFIYMDGKRKVGRQRIPQEFYKREEQLKKASF